MYSILIVDDDLDQLVMMGVKALSLGYVVMLASSKEQAIHVLNTNKVDVVLTDYKLQDGTGTDIIAEVVTNLPDVVTILISGAVRLPATVGEGLFDDYLVKPVDMDLLKKTITSCLEVREEERKEELAERAA